jgi:hypothetical protein
MKNFGAKYIFSLMIFFSTQQLLADGTSMSCQGFYNEQPIKLQAFLGFSESPVFGKTWTLQQVLSTNMSVEQMTALGIRPPQYEKITLHPNSSFLRPFFFVPEKSEGSWAELSPYFGKYLTHKYKFQFSVLEQNTVLSTISTSYFVQGIKTVNLTEQNKPRLQWELKIYSQTKEMQGQYLRGPSSQFEQIKASLNCFFQK